MILRRTFLIAFCPLVLIVLLWGALWLRHRPLTSEERVFRAAYKGDWKGFLDAIEECSTVDFFDEYGQTPLSLASYQDVGVVKKIIDQGADVNLPEGGRGSGHSTPLHRAAYMGRTEVSDVLLKAGANPNALDGYGRTPLATACASRHVVHPELLHVLLRNGADPNVRDKHGWAPLHLILRRSHSEKPDKVLIEVLLEYGADPAMRNNSIAAYADSGVSPEDLPPIGDTPCEIATNRGYADILEVLKDHLKSGSAVREPNSADTSGLRY